jgi:hypothetical protein
MSSSQSSRLAMKIKGTLLISALTGSPDLEQYTTEASQLQLGIVLGLDLGCNREKLVPGFILELFSSIKIKQIRDRIIEVEKKVNDFLLAFRSKSMKASASQASYFLSDHPVYRVGRESITFLQDRLDIMRDHAGSSRWKDVLISSKEAALFDPTGLSSKRTHLVFMGSCLVTLNKTKVLIRTEQEFRRSNVVSGPASRRG